MNAFNYIYSQPERDSYSYETQPAFPTLRELFFREFRLPEFTGFMSTLQQQRLIVEQLRRENAIRRINVSQAVEDIKRFVLENQKDDCLIKGFHPPQRNPFREKSPCSLL